MLIGWFVASLVSGTRILTKNSNINGVLAALNTNEKKGSMELHVYICI